MRKTFFVLSLMVLASAPAQATDYVLKYIDCPMEIRITLDFVKHIGSDPTFTEAGGGGMSSAAKNTSIDRDGQTISCSYRGTGIFTGRFAKYSYKVHRKILDCQHVGTGNLKCRLEP